ncbi:MAG: sulfotransferase [Gammaproteobacteria bacterium]|nr:sulfotransferase [Gammaproteobacteria bacterium]
MTHLDALLTVFPDACIIQTHRDPAACIPSLCGVIWPGAASSMGEVDAREVGPRELEFWAGPPSVPSSSGERRPERFFDVRFADFQRQPMAVVDAIFRHFSLELSPQAEQQMKQWLAANPRHKHGRHEYSAEQYGLSTSSDCVVLPPPVTDEEGALIALAVGLRGAQGRVGGGNKVLTGAGPIGLSAAFWAQRPGRAVSR